jgi:hypothetical protein
MIERHKWASYPSAFYIGQEVRILYNPSNPKEYLLDYGTVDWDMLGCTLVGIVFIAGALCAHFFG